MKSILSAILLLLPLLVQAVTRETDSIAPGTRVYRTRVIEDNPRVYQTPVYQAQVIEAETIIECDDCSAKAPKPLRPVFAAYTLGIGSAHLADTYLTPLRYSGSHYGLDYLRYQAAPFCPERLSMRLNVNLSVDHTTNPAGNATMWSALLTLDWGVIHRFKAPISAIPELTLGAGASINLQAGCLYNARNGNNPASARGAATLCVTGYAAYPIRLGRLPVTLMYQPSLPLTGVFFSPDYGELYYEIYLGNHSGLAHCAWWGNYFMLDNLLTADLSLGATSVRLGYSGRIFSSKVNHIVTNIFTHALVVGISGEWMSINPRKGISPAARIISATY